ACRTRRRPDGVTRWRGKEKAGIAPAFLHMDAEKIAALALRTEELTRPDHRGGNAGVRCQEAEPRAVIILLQPPMRATVCRILSKDLHIYLFYKRLRAQCDLHCRRGGTQRGDPSSGAGGGTGRLLRS